MSTTQNQGPHHPVSDIEDTIGRNPDNDRVVRPDLLPMRFRERGERQHVGLGLAHHGGHFGEAVCQGVNHPGFMHTPLLVCRRLSGWLLIVVVGFVLHGWDPAEAVHEPGGAVPADPVGGEQIHVG